MEKKILQNTRIGISEQDIIAETDKHKLYSWSIEIQKDINDLKGRIDQAKDLKALDNITTDQSQFRKWEYVLRIQGTLKQRIELQISLINQKEKEDREKRFEFAFVNIAKRILKDDLFQEIRTQALEEVSL